MASKYGWWSVSFDLKLEGQQVYWDELSDVTQEHICKEILGGYRQGEICEEDDED